MAGPGTGTTPTLIGGAIPLGATEPLNAGLSPTIIVPGIVPGLTAGPSATPGMPAPNMTPALALPSATPCTGAAGSTGGPTMIQGSPASC